MAVDRTWLEKVIALIHRADTQESLVDITLFFNRRHKITGEKKPPMVQYREHGQL